MTEEYTQNQENLIPTVKDKPTDESESIDTNHDLLNRSEPFAPAINIPENLYHNIKLKLKALSNRDKILQIKLAKYQKKHENLNMFIIVVSSILGIYETFRVKIDDLVMTKFLDIGSNIVPIFLSGIITCTASIIKLKKYQEKSDTIHLTREKVSVARTNLKTVQEHLLFCKSSDELEKIRKIYFKTTFDSYCSAQSYLDKHVKEIDYLKYGQKINYSDGFCVEDEEDEEKGSESSKKGSPKKYNSKKDNPKNVKVNKPLLNMNISYDFKKAKELNNDVSEESSDKSDDDTELSTPETRPTLSNNSSN
jgi:hypothetical protein